MRAPSVACGQRLLQDGDDRRPLILATDLRRIVEAASPSWLGSQDEPRPPTSAWVYGPGEYELGQLRRVVAEGFAASRHVHYSDGYSRPSTRLVLARAMPAGEELRCQVPPTATVTVDGVAVSSVTGQVTVAARAVPRVLELVLEDPETAPPALGLSPRQAGGWRVQVDSQGWVPAHVRAGGEVPPHRLGEPPRQLPMTWRPDGLWELPGPALGRVVVASASKPVVVPGESVAEAAATTTAQETWAGMEAYGVGRWRSSHALGIRYLAVRGADPTGVWVEAAVRPAAGGGVFACSDEELTRIGAAGAQTLRLCMQGLMVDGIKRDRMPWAGDQALSTMVNAYTAGDAAIARDSSVASGAVRHGYVNGIADYSLWWVVNNGLLNLYFGDTGGWAALDQAERVHHFLDDLSRHVGTDGVFRPAEEPDGFAEAGAGSVFLDWGVVVEAGRDSTALQMLWVWALRTAADLLDGAGHPGAPRWRGTANQVEEVLRQRGWDASAGCWREYLDPQGRPDVSYPNFLAVLAGIAPPNGAGGNLLEVVRSASVGTPFMQTFALAALLRLGEPDLVVQCLRDRWGPMLSVGARTFWEEFGTAEDEVSMYGRPFGKSLCHAWAAGPAALLPQAVLGLRPLAPGWADFEVAPHLGELEWAGAAVPVPGGAEILVLADRAQVRVEVPPGSVLHREGQRWVGPCWATWAVSGPG